MEEFDEDDPRATLLDDLRVATMIATLLAYALCLAVLVICGLVVERFLY